jgi:hypothetical protein
VNLIEMDHQSEQVQIQRPERQVEDRAMVCGDAVAIVLIEPELVW